MPKGQMKYKAGKFTFLLVCLFLCVGCGTQEAVFYAGTQSVEEAEKETHPEETTVPEMADVVKKEESQPKLININTAELDELMMLPGIGEVRAGAIIAYRQSVGEFQTIEDIMNVKGIKTGIFSKINSLICVK